LIRTVMDPVCETEIRPDEAVAVASFEGHRVHFCSENCYEEFIDVPHSFVGWADDPGRKRGRRRFRLDLLGLANGGGTGR
jgi:YHS domain-containing protein